MGLDVKRLQELRQIRGLSKNKLARMSGVSQGYLSDLERGKKEAPSAPILARVAEALGTSTDYLLGLTENPYPIPKRTEEQPAASLPGWLVEACEEAPELRELAALVPLLTQDQRRTVLDLVYSMLRPTLLRRHPWLKKLPVEIRDRMLPLAAQNWHHRYSYGGEKDLAKWPEDALLTLCSAMLSDYEREQKKAAGREKNKDKETDKDTMA